MSDEPTGQPPEEPAAPQEDALASKSPEELKGMVQEQSSHIGKLNTDLGDLRSKIERLEANSQLEMGNFGQQVPSYQQPYQEPHNPYVPQMPQAPLYQQPPQWQPVNLDWTDPDKAAMTAADIRASQTEQRLMQMNLQQRIQDNFSRAQVALQDVDRHMASNKRLYEGIEEDVKKQIGSFMPYINNGVNIEPVLRNQEVIDNIAVTIRRRRGEYDRTVPDGPPVSPTTTETPQARQAQIDGEPEVQFSAEDLKFMEQQGLTKEQAEKIVLEEHNKRMADGTLGK